MNQDHRLFTGNAFEFEKRISKGKSSLTLNITFYISSLFFNLTFGVRIFPQIVQFLFCSLAL